MAQKTTKTTKSAKVPKPRTSPEAGKKAAVPKSAVARTVDLSEDVLKSVETGQRAAIEAVRKFVETVDEALPAVGGRPSRRETVIDAALEMADRLVTTQYDFLRGVVREAGRSLSEPGAKKSEPAKKK